jgi:hypothetical protein
MTSPNVLENSTALASQIGDAIQLMKPARKRERGRDKKIIL